MLWSSICCCGLFWFWFWFWFMLRVPTLGGVIDGVSLREMVELFSELAGNPDCRVVVFSGAGKMFTAGGGGAGWWSRFCWLVLTLRLILSGVPVQVSI